MNEHIGEKIDQAQKYSIINCQNCGFIHISPVPENEELKKIYSDEYYTDEKPKYIEHNIEDFTWWETVYKDRIDRIEILKKTKTKRLLEIGSGPGLFLKYAQKRGWDVLGIEISKQAANFSKKNNIPIIEKLYQDVNFKTLNKFDAIAMFEFLEHLPNPVEVLKLSYKALKKGGIVCIGVPNDYNPLQKIVKSHLKLKPYWLAPPHHINYFTIDSLTKLLEKNGFEVVYKETNFPLEMFLLMGENYVGNDNMGRLIHSKRKKFDIALTKHNNNLKLKLYKQLADLHIGRDLTIYGKKA